MSNEKNHPFALQESVVEILKRCGANCGSYAFYRKDAEEEQEATGAWGNYRYNGQSFGASSMAAYDLASLTKLFTVTAILLLQEQGVLSLDQGVRDILPEFQREDVTVRHLMTHTSNLALYLSDIRATAPTPEALRHAMMTAGKREGDYFYQDPNMILLGWIVERLSGQSLDCFMQENIFDPLQMEGTGFRIHTTSRVSHTPPTRLEGDRVNAGEVHDHTARIFGGVTGHAGLFSTVEDMRVFLRAWRTGEGLLRPETIQEALQPVYVGESFAQALGWKLHAPREDLNMYLKDAYMHGGFTGTLCLFNDVLEVVILTDFVYPGERSPEERALWWNTMREAVQLLTRG